MKLLGILSLLLFSVSAYASGTAHHEIPYKAVFVQFVNFSIMFVLMVFLTRKAIAKVFKERHKKFHSELEKAHVAKQEADRKKQVISERLKRLKDNQNTDLQKAKSDAEELRQKIILEAKKISEKMEDDAQRMAKYEFDRAVEEIRLSLLNNSINTAKEKLKNEVDGTDLKRLRGEFVEKIQVVH